jgi:hypothetical protein
MKELRRRFFTKASLLDSRRRYERQVCRVNCERLRISEVLLVTVAAVIHVTGCGRQQERQGGRSCEVILLWNASATEITDAFVYIGKAKCPAGSLYSGEKKASDGLSIRADTARVTWTTKDGLKHEELIDLNKALPEKVSGAELWFRINEDERADLIVRNRGEPAPDGKGP